eukprot:9288399-Pyramimonas_sp.AAC.1
MCDKSTPTTLQQHRCRRAAVRAASRPDSQTDNLYLTPSDLETGYCSEILEEEASLDGSGNVETSTFTMSVPSALEGGPKKLSRPTAARARRGRSGAQEARR